MTKKEDIIHMIKKQNLKGTWSFTFQRIADEFGCKKQYISQIAKENNLSRKSSKVKSSKVKSNLNFSIKEFENLEKKTIKLLLLEYIFAINRGHKSYEKYNFKNNHEFLAKVIEMVNNL